MGKKTEVTAAACERKDKFLRLNLYDFWGLSTVSYWDCLSVEVFAEKCMTTLCLVGWSDQAPRIRQRLPLGTDFQAWK
jgi:hypothetical protein